MLYLKNALRSVKIHQRGHWFVPSLFIALSSLPAHALIIGGGTATSDSPTNTTNYDPTTGQSVFGWEYVARATYNAVYLGNGWVITAHHVGTPTSIDLGDLGTYSVIANSTIQIKNPTVSGDSLSGTTTDLILYRINTTSTTGSLLDLAPLVLPTSTPTASTKVTMISEGPWVARPTYYAYDSNNKIFTAVSSASSATVAGYDYSTTSWWGVKRWGYNTISSTNDTYTNNLGDQVHALGSILYTWGKTNSSGVTYESALANGDSGGGLFGSSEAVGLLGILDAKFDYTNQPSNVAIFGSKSASVNIAWYAANIATAMNMYQWTSNLSGNWSDARWNGFLNSSAVAGPNSAGATVNLLANPLSQITITLTNSPTVGTLNLNNTTSYTITTSTSQTLTFDNSNTGALLADWEGSHALKVGLLLNDNLTVHVKTSTDTLTVNSFASTASKSLSLTGTGTLLVNGNITNLSTITNAETASLKILGNITGTTQITNASTGSITLSGTNTYTGGTTVAAGTLTFSSALSRPSNDQLIINKSGTNYGMVVVTNDASNLNTYRTQLYNGLAGSTTGPVIKSTMNITGESIGYLIGADYNAIHGTSYNTNDVILRYTLIGDVDLDGKISTFDYLQIDSSYYSNQYSTPGSNAHWVNGDFNYDGMVNYLDFALMDAAYSIQTANSLAAQNQVTLDAATFGADYLAAYNDAYSSALASVPEPSSLALLLLGTLTLASRRSSRR